MEDATAALESPPSRNSLTQDVQRAESSLSLKDGMGGVDGEDGQRAGNGEDQEGVEDVIYVEGEEQQMDEEMEEEDEYYGLDQHEIDYLEQREKRRNQLQLQLLDKTKIPPSYYSLSKKETMVLEYVDNFNRQYLQLYPGRKELLLCPTNEFGFKVIARMMLHPYFR
jgi:hypothetical protein